MIVKRLYAENFLGLKESHLQPRKRMVLVVGANGVGKSSLADAFVWCLTSRARGRSQKDVAEMLHDEAKRFKLMVDIEMGNGKDRRTVELRRSRSTGSTLVAKQLGVSPAQLQAVLGGWHPESGLSSFEPAVLGDLIGRSAGSIPKPADLDQAGITHAKARTFVLEGNWGGALRDISTARRLAEAKAGALAQEPVFEDSSGKKWRLMDVDLGGLEARIRTLRETEAALAEKEKEEAALSSKQVAARKYLETAPATQEKLKPAQGDHKAVTIRHKEAGEQLKKQQEEQDQTDSSIRHWAEKKEALAKTQVGEEGLICPLADRLCPSQGFLGQWFKKNSAAVTAQLDVLRSQRADRQQEIEGLELQMSEYATKMRKLAKDAAQYVTIGENIARAQDVLGQRLREADEAPPGETLVEVRGLRERLEAVTTKAKAYQAQSPQEATEELQRLKEQETQLKPEGLPAVWARKPLDEFRELLHAVSASDELEVTDDFTLRWRGRPASLASKSERLLINLQVQAALSTLSGLRFLLLDELDLFRGRALSVTVNYLLGLLQSDTLDQVVAFATTDLERSQIRSQPNVEMWWMDGGGRLALC